MPAGALVLVPTQAEADELALDGPVEVCGFGLADAGVRAARAIQLHAPARVVLAGIAGSYDLNAAPIGSAVRLGRVRCVGIGAGGRSAAELGFAAADELPLDASGPLALSVTEASDSTETYLISLIEHDLFGKPVSTFPDHALHGCAFEKVTVHDPAVPRPRAEARARHGWIMDSYLLKRASV